ncbi:transporter [Desulfobacterales bacterium HSG2]|nr:transporter [Desulfobacterales bacterium HSG2]
MYNVFYTADTLTDDNGDDIDAVDFDVSVFANVHRFIWMSDLKILGADFGANIIIPLISTDIEVKAKGGPTLTDDSKFSLGDICLEPFMLSWHGPQYDAAAGLGVYFPVGEYDKNEPASPGKDMWTGMFTLGGTLYFDAERSWSASILGRYETHSEQGDRDVTYGDDLHFEWAWPKHSTSSGMLVWLVIPSGR